MRRRLEGRLFLFLCAFYLLTSSGRLRTVDEYETFYTAESLLDRGSLALPPEKAFFGRSASGGSFYAPYGPLQALLAVPFLGASRLVSGAFGLDPAKKEVLSWVFASSLNAGLAAAAVILLCGLLRLLGAQPKAALAVALTYAFASPLWHYAGTFFSEPLSAALLLGCAVLLAYAEKSDGDSPRAPFFAAGALLGAAFFVRMTHAIYLPAFALAAAGAAGGDKRRRLEAAGWFLSLPCLALLLYASWNFLRFGEPLNPGYPDRFEGDRAPGSFEEPFLRGFFGLTFSPGKGLFVFCPAALLGAIEVLRRRPRGAAGALVLLGPTALLFYSKYAYWEGGYSWGPRFLVPALAFWLLPLAFSGAPNRAAKLARGLAVAWGGIMGVLGTAVSFLECQVGCGYYLDGFRYNLAYSAAPAALEVLVRHFQGAWSGALFAGPLGVGFDLWPVFLARAGFDPAAVCAVWGVVLAVAVVFGVRLRAAFKSEGGRRASPRAIRRA